MYYDFTIPIMSNLLFYINLLYLCFKDLVTVLLIEFFGKIMITFITNYFSSVPQNINYSDFLSEAFEKISLLYKQLKFLIILTSYNFLSSSELISIYLMDYAISNPNDEPISFIIFGFYLINLISLTILTESISDKINNSIIPGKYINPMQSIECCICLKNECNWSLACKHKFHYKCIKKWYSKTNQEYHDCCPICRIKME